VAAGLAELRRELAPRPPPEPLEPARLAALQARLEGLGAAGLLAEAEVFALEDEIADACELRRA
jgi:hypothetical protein